MPRTRIPLALLALTIACGVPALRAEELEAERYPDTISKDLADRIARKSFDDVIVDVVWEEPRNQLTACRVWGTGIGLWDRSDQFRLTKEETLAILEAVQKSGFGTLDTSLPEEGGSEGRIRVFVGFNSRTVWQMEPKEPGARQLEELAKAVFRITSTPRQHAVTMANMQDGLEKLRKGTLAPEALEVAFRKKTDHPGPGVEPEDWLVQIDGLQVLDRIRTGDRKEPLRERSLTLSSADLQALLDMLVAADLSHMHESLYATQYSNMRVVVLNQTRNIQARQHAGMTPTQHGEKQAAFDRLFAWGAALHARALKEGKPVHRVIPPSPQRRREKEGEKEKD